jgi:DNA-binding transcriptional MocR family regulator
MDSDTTMPNQVAPFPGGGVIDLSRSIPPPVPEIDALIRLAFAELAGTTLNLGERLRTAVLGGRAQDREIAANLLSRRFGQPIDPARILLGNGNQNLLTLLLQELVGRGNTLLAEELTYTVLISLAGRSGIGLRAVGIDADGLRSDDFADAIRTHRAKAVFVNPTVHNPTTAVMPLERRLEVAAIAREEGVAIIEDDVLGFLHPEAPPPFAAIAGDITWYLMGLTKSISQGMRLAYLVAPSAEAAARLVEPVKDLSMWSASPIAALVLEQLASTGRVETIFRAIRDEAEARQAIAARHLDPRLVTTQPGALHLWLTLPAGWARAEFVRAAEQRGVIVRAADRFALTGARIPEAVRLSLASPAQREDVDRGTAIIAELLQSRGSAI